MNFDSLNDKFSVEFIAHSDTNSFEKIRVDKSEVFNVLKALKNMPEFDFDVLITMVAIDLGVENKHFELIYDLYSTQNNKCVKISALIDRNNPVIPSIVSLFKSAYFDECEIFDLMGIKFENNSNLKRLLLPEGWEGFPLRKDYVLDDTRLKWNEA